MLRNTLLVLAVSTLLSACGGSDNNSQTSSSSESSVSSAEASSVSSVEESSVASSESSATESSVSSAVESSSVESTASSESSASSEASVSSESSESSSVIVVETSSSEQSSSAPASSSESSASVSSSSLSSSSEASSSLSSSSEASSSSSSTASSESSSAASSVAAVLSFNFDADADDSTYASFGWSDPAVTATVKPIASITGLAANSTSTKVLQAVTLDWNAFVKFTFTLPAGKTLANYALQVDAYFPYATMGHTTSDNYYKDLMLFAGTSISGSPTTSNADYQSTRGNTPAWDEVDAWKTLTLNFDSTKAALLSGTVEVAVGINRPAATTADAYYLDNVQLVEIP